MLNRHDKKNSVLSGMIIEASHGVTISALLTRAIAGIADAIVARRERRLCAKQHRHAKREIAKLSTEMQHDIGWPGRYELENSCANAND